MSQVDEGMKTNSVLTISNVTGYDSNIVVCCSRFDTATDDSTVMSETALNVLGEIVSVWYRMLAP